MLSQYYLFLYVQFLVNNVKEESVRLRFSELEY